MVWWSVVVLLAVYLVLFVRYAAHWDTNADLWDYTASLTPTHPLAPINAAIAHQQTQDGFVYQDWVWTQACAPSSNAEYQPRGLRGIPRSLAHGSWCWQLQAGDSVRSFHAVNLALHLTTALALCVLISQMVGSISIGLAIGLLFAVHPLVTESAIYLAGRGELIAGLGVVLACLAALHREWLTAVASITFGVLGKETALVALAAMPCVLFAMGRLSAWKAATIGISVALTMGVLAYVGRLEMVTLSERWDWLLLQSTAAVWLGALSVVPLWQSPLHYYGDVPTLARLLCLMAVCSLGVVAWRQRVTAPFVACGMGWTLLTVLPRLVVPTPPSVLNEHQFYVPLMGLSFMGAHALRRMHGD